MRCAEVIFVLEIRTSYELERTKAPPRRFASVSEWCRLWGSPKLRTRSGPCLSPETDTKLSETCRSNRMLSAAASRNCVEVLHRDVPRRFTHLSVEIVVRITLIWPTTV